MLRLIAVVLAIGTASGQYTISTVAGTGRATFSGDNGPATNAGIVPHSVAPDNAGNFYIVDVGSNRIRKVNSAGVITTFAGGGQNYPGTGSPATSVGFFGLSAIGVDSAGNVYACNGGGGVVMRINKSGIVSLVTDQAAGPSGVAVDAAGNAYIANVYSNNVLKVSASGLLTTLAGTGSYGFSGDNGQAVNAQMNGPAGVAVDGAGNVYIADSGNNRIRKVNPAGIITTVAGNGTGSYLGDGGQAVNAELNGPSGVALDTAGNLFIADYYNSVIRMVDTTGTIMTVAGTGAKGESGDDGPALNAQLSEPTSIAVDSSGNVYFADSGTDRVRLLTPAQSAGSSPASITALNPSAAIAGSGLVSLTVAGSDFAPGAVVEWNDMALSTTLVSATQLTAIVPQSLTASAGSASITVLNPSATASNAFPFAVLAPTTSTGSGAGPYTITTVAGTGRTTFSGDGGPATNAGMIPGSVAPDNAGNFYIADVSGNRIRKVNSAGVITTFAGGGQNYPGTGSPATSVGFFGLSAIGVDSAGNVYACNGGGGVVMRINKSGIVSLVTDQAAGPSGVAVDAAGNAYIANDYSNNVLKVSASGLLTTLAGTGSYGFSGDNGRAVNAQMNRPVGVAVDGAGNVYIADSGNNRIRKVNPAGIITTVAGNGTGSYLGDGGQAVNAELNGPSGVAMDTAGNLFIADYYNSVIRMVDTTGTIMTVAGTGAKGESGDDGPALNAQLSEPTSIAVDSSGNIYFADSGNNRVRLLTPAQTTAPSPASLTSLSPASAVAGSAAFTLTINGSNFATGAVAQWSGLALATTFAGSTQLTASVPANLVAAAGTAALTVLNPGAAVSNPLTFTINSPAPPCAPTGLLIQVIAPGSGFAAPVGQPLNIEVEAADNCGIVTSGTVQATFSNGDPGVQLAGIGQGNFAAVWAPANAAQPSVVITVTAFETVGPGRILSGQVAVSGIVVPTQTQNLTTSVTSLRFSQSQGASPTSLRLTVLNQGSGTASFAVTASTSSGGAWLSVAPASGNVSAGSPATITVTASPGALTAGTYSGTVAVQSGAQTLPPVNVTMTVSATQPILLLSQTALSFTAAQGGGAPLPQDFGILNIGQGTLNWTAQAAVRGTTVNWLSLSSTSGIVSQPFLGVSSIDVAVNQSGLAPGTYYGQIQVNAQGVDNSPQTLSVVLTVLPMGTNPGPQINPTGIIFTGPQTPSPPAQAVMISNTSAKPSVFGSGTVTVPPVGAWFSNSPSSATTVPGQPLQMSIQPDFSHLPGGATRGVVTLAFDDGSIRNVSLLAVIPPTASGGSGAHFAGGCTPSQLNIQPSGLQPPIGASIGQPITIQALVVDDCGQAVTNNPSNSVQATFSNGDPGGAMVHVGNGRWVKTWQPQKPSAPNVPAAVTVTAYVAMSSGKLLANQVDIPVTFGSPSNVPSVVSGGVFNAASYASPSLVAPGSLIAIYGANLANGAPAQSASAPLPTQLGNTGVLLAGRMLPLLYTSDGQINAQVPYDIQVDIPTQLVVESGATLSVPEPVTIATAQPAVFTVDQSGQGQGVILNGLTNQLADSNAPVTAGDTVVIYGTGLGAVSPGLTPGNPATGPTLTVQPVTVNIGGQAASVAYAGLTPGFAGLYQVNAVVPRGVAPGSQVPVILTTAGQSSPVVTMAIR